MLCILCVTASEQFIHIFDDEGHQHNISSVISKHFWLQPSKEDANSKVICCSCWNTLEGFHKFYLKVEEAYAKLVSIKLSKDDEGSCGDSYDAFPDTLTEDIKTESCDYFKNDIAFADVENSVSQPDHNQAKQTIKSDTESNVSLVVLSKRRKCPRRGRSKAIPSSNADITSGSDERNRRNEDSTEEKPNTEIGSDWSASRSTDKQKKKSTDEDSGYKSFTVQGGNQKRISCKQFDEVINQNMKLSCEICRKPLTSFFTLKEHYRFTHKEIGYVTCCDRKFNSRHALAHHILQHQNPDLFKCEKCGKMLSNYKSLNTHMKVHINDRRSFECDKCNKSFARKEKLERHMQTHVKVQRICEQCGKVTRALRQHQIREHSDMPRQRVQCQKCGVYLADASTLHTHMKYQHPQTKVTHVCNICGKISLTGYGLKRHIAYMHKYGRRHKCGLCEKAFKTAQKLREHMTIHTGEVLYTCPHCPKTFNSNANMHSHRKKMHRKEWEENRRHPNMGAAPTTE